MDRVGERLQAGERTHTLGCTNKVILHRTLLMQHEEPYIPEATPVADIPLYPDDRNRAPHPRKVHRDYPECCLNSENCITRAKTDKRRGSMTSNARVKENRSGCFLNRYNYTASEITKDKRLFFRVYFLQVRSVLLYKFYVRRVRLRRR